MTDAVDKIIGSYARHFPRHPINVSINAKKVICNKLQLLNNAGINSTKNQSAYHINTVLIQMGISYLFKCFSTNNDSMLSCGFMYSFIEKILKTSKGLKK